MNNPDPNYSEERLFVETVWRKGRGEIERAYPHTLSVRDKRDPLKRQKKNKKIK